MAIVSVNTLAIRVVKQSALTECFICEIRLWMEHSAPQILQQFVFKGSALKQVVMESWAPA